jgi:hypothetical protein
MDVARTEGIVVGNQPCWRRPLEGWLENKDTLVGKGGFIPAGVRV